MIKLCKFYLPTLRPLKLNIGIKMNDLYQSVAEICLYLGIKRDTVYRWVKKGFPAHLAGKFWKFKISEVDEWVKMKSNKNNL